MYFYNFISYNILAIIIKYKFIIIKYSCNLIVLKVFHTIKKRYLYNQKYFNIFELKTKKIYHYNIIK